MKIAQCEDAGLPFEDVVSVGDEILVKVVEIDNQGRINLSRKDALADIAAKQGK